MKFFLLFSLFGVMTFLRAQDESYLPTAIEGANWIIKNSDVDTSRYLSYVHSIEGDTMVGGHTYKKLYRRVIDHVQEVFTDPPLARPYRVFPGRELITLLRDKVEERQVFGRIRALSADEIIFGPDTLLHDYSLEEGDTLRGVNFDDSRGPSVINEVRFENIYGEIRRVQVVNGHKYYEGVGSDVWGPTSGPSLLVAMGIFSLRDYCVGTLENCRVWLTPVTNLSADASINTYPNPFTTQLNFLPSENLRDEPIMVVLREITGRIIRQGELGTGLQWSTQELPPGWYTATYTSGTQRATVKLVKQ